MNSNIKTGTFLLASLFLLEFAGYWTHSLNLLFGVVFLGTTTVLHLREFGKGTSLLRKLIGATLLCASIYAMPDLWIPRRAALLAIFAIGLSLFNGGRDTSSRVLLSLSLAFVATTFLLAAYLNPGAAVFWPDGGITFFMLIKKASLAISSVASFATGQPLALGPSFSGLFITATLLLYILAASDFFRMKNRKPWLKTALFILCTQLIYLIFFAFVPILILKIFPGAKVPPEPTTVGSWLWNYYPLYMPFFLSLAAVSVLVLSAPKGEVPEKKPEPLIWRILRSPLIFILAGVGLFMMDTAFPGKPDKDKIVFYEKGYLNWDRPNYLNFGNYSGGMFGNLPPFVESLGMKARMTPDLNEATLCDAEILMMMNVCEPVSEDEIRCIWDFVEKGGSLLLLGDHTQRDKNGKNWMNKILEPSRIRYNFDSADFFIGGWQHSSQFLRAPVSLNVSDVYNHAGIVIGASLSAEYPAIPLIAGRFGYSDPGEESAGEERGYLGNLDFDPGEELGDIVLVAAQDYGKGKVMVFGDTSSFANPLLFNTHKFVNSVFTFLRQSDVKILSKWRITTGLLFLASALCLMISGGSGLNPVFVAALSFLLASYTSDKIISAGQMGIPHGKVAYIDSSHIENFDFEGWNDSGNTGLIYNVMRAGYNTFSMDKFSPVRLAAADLYIVANPTKPFTGEEIKAIENFVDKGGILFVNAGWEESGPVEKLLDVFDFSIGNQPLGGTHKEMIMVSGEEGIRANLIEAWPVECGAPHEVLLSWMGKPVIAMRSFGKGRVCVVADSQFLTNRMLEHETHGHLEAIMFFRWLIFKMKGEIPPPMEFKGKTKKHE